jgi:CheY-like chemotaxis protein
MDPKSGVRSAPAADAAPTVLVVDDDPAVRRMAARMLRARDYAVVEAADGVHARTLLKAGAAVALVLTDVRMPGLSGPELAAWLAVAHPGVPALLMTGTPASLDPSAGHARAIGPVLRKPFTGAELAAAVRAALAVA